MSTLLSQASGPARWVSTDDGTFDADATCPRCGHEGAQVLGGAGTTVRCRCTECMRTFLHMLWIDPDRPRRRLGPR